MSDFNDPSIADGATILVSTQVELDAALAAVTGGETILLSAGAYDSISLSGRTFAERVTIRSADPADPAVFTGAIFLRNVTGLEFEGVDVIGSEPLKPGAPRILVMGGGDIAFSEMKLFGALWEPEAGVEDELAGMPQDYGIRITDASNVSLSDMEFTQVNKAITFFNSEGVTISSSEFHNIRSDGIAFASSSDILIEDNYFHDFHPLIKPNGAGDHPDFIQFMGDHSGIGIDNLKIRDNAFIQGDGEAVQAIFGWSSFSIVPFTNFEISGNVIQNSAGAGISISDAVGVSVHDNILIPAGAPVLTAETGWRPAITVSWRANEEAPQDVDVRDNIVTLSWNPVFNPTALTDAENALRGNVFGEVVVLDQGKAVPAYWRDVTLPDRNNFEDHDAWVEAVLDHLREALPEDVAARLPERPAELEASFEAPPETSGDIFRVSEGYHRLEKVDFDAGDAIHFEGEATLIDTMGALLERAAVAGARHPADADLRLVETTGAGERVLDIDLNGVGGAGEVRPDIDRGLVKLATGDSLSFDFGAELIAGAAASPGLLAAVDDRALSLRDDSTAGGGHRLEQVNYAVLDAAGLMSLGSVAVAVRDSQASLSQGGAGDDKLASGHGDDALIGRAGDDFLYARRGDDWLDGGRGNDRLTGGQGSDMMIGGAGADKFVFYGTDARNGDHDIVADLDFAEGDRLVFGHFEAGTFSEAYRWSTGDSAGIISVEGVIGLGKEEDFGVVRLGEGHALLTYATRDGGEAEIEILFAGASAAAFEAAWSGA